MESFKTVRDLARKPINQSNSQKDWNSWKNTSTNKRQKGIDVTNNTGEKDHDEFAPSTTNTGNETKQENITTTNDDNNNDDNNSSSDNDEQNNKIQGEEDDEQEQNIIEEDSKMDTRTLITNTNNKPITLPHPRTWRSTFDPLTRRPTWYCKSLGITITTPPLELPWRVEPNTAKDAPQSYYWWNPTTNETRWN
jgi:hypothetical protein